MARRKADQVSVQLDVRDEEQWQRALARPGLTVADLYAGWCGPCTALQDTLKKVKFEVGEDRLHLITACTDSIEALTLFRGRSEALWVFFIGGQPVYMQRGANATLLTKMILHYLDMETKIENGRADRIVVDLVCDPARQITVDLVTPASQRISESDGELPAAPAQMSLQLHSVLLLSQHLQPHVQEIVSILAKCQFVPVTDITLSVHETDQLLQSLNQDQAKEQAVVTADTSPEFGQCSAPLPPPDVVSNFLHTGIQCLVLKDTRSSQNGTALPNRWLTEFFGHLVGSTSEEEQALEDHYNQEDEANGSAVPAALEEEEPGVGANPVSEATDGHVLTSDGIKSSLLDLITATVTADNALMHLWSPDSQTDQEWLLRRLCPDLVHSLLTHPDSGCVGVVFALFSADVDLQLVCQHVSRVDSTERADVQKSADTEQSPATNSDTFSVLYTGSGPLNAEMAAKLAIEPSDATSLQALVVKAKDAKLIANKLATFSPILVIEHTEPAASQAARLLVEWGAAPDFLSTHTHPPVTAAYTNSPTHISASLDHDQ